MSLVGVGAFAGYGYCTQRAEEDGLRDCAVDTSINAYRTLWGSPTTSSDVTTAKGTVETESFESKALDRTMEYVVYLPPGYNDPQNASTRDPVVYLLPGSSDGTDTWVKSGVKENQKFAEKLKARGASFDFETYPGKHNWDLWREHLPDFLVFASEHLTGGK